MITTTVSPFRRSWLNDAIAVLGERPVAGSASSDLEPIDETVNFPDLIPWDLPSTFASWILEVLEDGLQEVIEAFTGDSAAIVAHATQCSALATAVYGMADGLETGPQHTPSWEGTGKEGFVATVNRAGECTRESARLLLELGDHHRVLGALVAEAKRFLIKSVNSLASELVSYALERIYSNGLVIIEGVVELAANVAKGALEGAAKGALFAVPGAIIGGVLGGKKGWDESDEIRQRLLDAFDAFVGGGGIFADFFLDKVSEYIETFIDRIAAVLGGMKAVGQVAERAAKILRTGEDPGFNADSPHSKGMGKRAQGKEPKEMDRALIALNRGIGKSDELPDGYKRATDEELAKLGLTPDMLVDENGFHAAVYMYTDADGRTHPVVAFAGTGSGGDTPTGASAWDDIWEDGIGAATVSPQTENVLAITEALSNSNKADGVVFTGHSLGGRLATIAALDTGNAAVTYNSAGVSRATIEYVAASNNKNADDLVRQANDGQVRRYNTENDPLTGVQERTPRADKIPDALGAPNTLPSYSSLIGGHELYKVEAMFNEKYPVGSLPSGL